MPGTHRAREGLTPLTGSWACVDLETTGGNPARNRIIEVAVVAVDDGVVVDEWSRLVAFGRPVPPAITETDPESDRSECHVIDHWRYLGSARDETEAAELASDPPAASFDRDHYRVLERWLRRHPQSARPLEGTR